MTMAPPNSPTLLPAPPAARGPRRILAVVAVDRPGAAKDTLCRLLEGLSG
jgi:hypothetical protein